MASNIQKQTDELKRRVVALEKVVFKKKSAPLQIGEKKATGKDLIIKIINKIGECEESELIESKILDKRNMEGKILLSFYVSCKYFKNAWLNTGDIERITSKMGIKIDVRNVTNKIKELRTYLESGSTRKKGQPTPYRLNRRGKKRFEEILEK